MATLDQALEQMLGAGLPPPPEGFLVPDGRLHRYGPKKRAWYRLFEYPARNGRRYISGVFGYWGLVDSTKVHTEWTGVDAQELERLREAQAERERAEAAKREHLARFASQRALAQWNGARARLAEGESVPYLKAKGVRPAKGLRFLADGTVLVPMVRYDVSEEQAQDPGYTGPRRLAGLQKIGPDGAKRFNKGMVKAGAACRLGGKPKDGELILIAEGLATALSVLQALDGGTAAFVAFDAGNLLPVARIVRGLYPASPLLFLADDDAYLEAQLNDRLREDFGAQALVRTDWGDHDLPAKPHALRVRADWHEDPNRVRVLMANVEFGPPEARRSRRLILENAGRTKAWAAAAAVGNAQAVWPEFAERVLFADSTLAGATKLTDFNDLHAVQGIDVVREQVAQAMVRLREARELAAALAQGMSPEAAKEAAAQATAGGKGGGKGGQDDIDWRLRESLLRRFTQVYPSDEAFDGEIGKLVKVAHMKLMFGTKPVGMWLASPRKRTVLLEDVVFDPTMTADPKRTVNLFRGLPVKPDASKACARLLDLAHYLCGEDPEDTHTPVTTWLLRWLAYPLQHPGAKMQTAVVMHGKEGTGKNMLFGTVRDIYGAHGGTISQMQLQSQFNDWLSAKLFLIANEVITRQELRHYVGYLKTLITEHEIYINPKNIGARSERNHCNLVFLSNEFHAMQISPDDRRYLVVNTPAARDKAYYEAVRAEIAAGGAAGLYAYLLELDLGDFAPHTKPIMTAAKEGLIEQGLASAQLFWTELKGEQLGLPYCPALVQDVYRAYLAWCARNGEKMPQSMSRFTPGFMSMNGVRRVVDRIDDPDDPVRLVLADKAARRQRKLFIMGDPEPTPEAEAQRRRQGVIEFRAALKLYLTEDVLPGARGAGAAFGGGVARGGLGDPPPWTQEGPPL